MALPDLDSSVGHSFGLEVDEITIESITEVSGLKTEQDVIELKQSGPDAKDTIKKLPGRRKAGEVTPTRPSQRTRASRSGSRTRHSTRSAMSARAVRWSSTTTKATASSGTS